MVKPVFVGLLSCLVVVVLFGGLIGNYAPADVVAVGDPGWREQHNQLVAISAVKLLTISGWFLSTFTGGLVGGLLSAGKCLRASSYIGGTIVLLSVLPTTIIPGFTMGWVHVASIAAVIVGSTVGGAFAMCFRKK